MKITLLVDLQDHELLASEFGLSFLWETPGGDFLFDTGSDTALQHNLAILNIPPEKVQKVILSHGHYDHTGGVAELQDQWPNVSVYLNHGDVYEDLYEYRPLV